MAIIILLLILISLRLIIGARLFASARQNNLPNLNWLGAYFILFSIGALFAPIQNNPLGNLPISLYFLIGVGTLLTQPVIIAFNHTTFYQGRESPALWFLIIFIITGITTVYGVYVSESNFNQSIWVSAYVPTQLLVWGWHGWAAYQAFKGLEQETAVEDWIKSRYRLIVWYIAFLMISVVASLIRVLFAGGSATNALGGIMAVITLLMQIASVALQFLVWIMPENFRQWLNRDQAKHSEEQVREQAQAILNILGETITEGAGLSKMMALIYIRKVISMQINSAEATQVEARAASMGFAEWTETLNHPELYTLIKSSGSNVNTYDALNRAKQVLIEKQSLFTMKAK
ncbi:MAG: hypothetical protein LC108_14990 [Anaerolineales bacterium]|nr:hypothetical protein [Anaerolineales bacterium]